MRLLSMAVGWVVLLLSGSVSAAEFHHETLDDGTVVIFLSGDIETGDDETFRELTIRYPNAILGLDSDGGALIPALEIGRLVRLRNYTTIVVDDGICVSSCALIWIAGPRRVLSTTASLGFHASYVDEGRVKVESGVANALVGHYLSQLNLPQSAVIFATLAPPSEIAWLDESNRNQAGIDFESLEAERPVSASPPPVQVAKAAPSVRPAPPPINVVGTESYGAPRPSATNSLIRQAFRAPGFAESAARGIGARPNLVEPLANHLRLIYANDAVIDRLSYEIDASGIDINANPQAAGSVLYRLSQRLIYNGLQRLPQRDVNRFYYYMAEAAVRQDSTCTAFADTGRASAGEFETISQLGAASLNEYLGIIRKAMFAEVENYPAAITLDATQTEIAENAWSEKLGERTADWSQAEYDMFMADLQNFESLDQVKSCQVLQILMPTISGMEGITGDWFRRVYLTYVSDSQ